MPCSKFNFTPVLTCSQVKLQPMVSISGSTKNVLNLLLKDTSLHPHVVFQLRSSISSPTFGTVDYRTEMDINLITVFCNRSKLELA